jgi:hypothetical protein
MVQCPGQAAVQLGTIAMDDLILVVSIFAIGTGSALRSPAIFFAIFAGALSVGSADAAQPISPRFKLADADCACVAYIGSVPVRSFLSSLSFRLQVKPDGKRSR